MSDEDERDARPPAPAVEGTGRKPYTAPTLTEHGPVESVTGNIGLKGSDGLMGSTLA